MKASFLAVVIALLHVVVISTVLFVQGCGTARVTAPQPPPAPVMPPMVGGETRVVPPEIMPPTPVGGTSVVTPEIKTYTVKSGDVLSRIANRCGVSVREICDLNSISSPDKIKIGQVLVLPAYSREIKATEVKPPVSAPASGVAVPTAAPPVEVKPGEIYKVVSGDVLSRIAVRHGTTVKELMKLNKLKSTKIIVGQKLRIPDGGVAVQPEHLPVSPAPVNSDVSAPTPAPLETGRTKTTNDSSPIVNEDKGVASIFAGSGAYEYTVAEGETVMKIAKDYIVDPRELRKLNNLADDEEVKPGQQILIPLSNL